MTFMTSHTQPWMHRKYRAKIACFMQAWHEFHPQLWAIRGLDEANESIGWKMEKITQCLHIIKTVIVQIVTILFCIFLISLRDLKCFCPL